MKSFTPTIYPPNNQLIGFDAEVYSIQQQLARLSWMEAIFGIARPQERYKSTAEAETMQAIGFRGTEKYTQAYPQGRANGKDVDLTFDDNYASRVFFLMRDASNINPKFDDWNWIESDFAISQPFSLIFHCNQKFLEQESTERLKTDIIWALNQCPKVIGSEFYEEMNNVWKEFTITPEINGITRYPNYCLRVDATCNYLGIPYNGQTGYYPSTSNLSRSVIGWKVCKVYANIVSSTPASTTQKLANGDSIPIEYNVDGSGNLAIPYLSQYAGIDVLSRFMLNGQYYQGNFFNSGIINTNSIGTLSAGDKLEFDASLPLFNI